MHSEIKSVFQLTELHGVKIIVYGRPCTGKTRLCSTLPRPLILSAESGLLSLRRVIKETGQDLPAWIIKDMNDLQQAYDFIQKPEAKQHFDSICVDSITEVAEIVLQSELRKTKDGRKAYGALYTNVVQILRDFRNLPNFNVYFAAQEDTEKDNMQNIFRFPSFPGQRLSAASLYQFDENFRAYTGRDPEGKVFYALQTQGDEYVDAKDRSGKLDPIEYPDLGHIIRKIME